MAEPTVGWGRLHYSFAHISSLRGSILLDSDTIDTIFCNEEYVTNIRLAPTTMVMNTNGGRMVSKQLCDVPHLGTVWFNKELLTKIISLYPIPGGNDRNYKDNDNCETID